MHLPLPGESVAPFKSLIIWDADVQTPTGSYQLLNKNTFSIDSSSHNSPKECSAAQAIWQLGHTTYFFSGQVTRQEVIRVSLNWIHTQITLLKSASSWNYLCPVPLFARQFAVWTFSKEASFQAQAMYGSWHGVLAADDSVGSAHNCVYHHIYTNKLHLLAS